MSPVNIYLWVEKSSEKVRQQQVMVIKIHEQKCRRKGPITHFYSFFSLDFFIFTTSSDVTIFCTMYYTTMYYILYTIFENVKYLKTCSGLQDQRAAGADYNLIDSVLLLYLSLVLIVGSSS